MFSQDFLLYEPEFGSSTHQHDRTHFSSSNAYLRELLDSTMSLSVMPPSCSTIGSPNWSGFSTTPKQTTPAGELKVSNLLRDRGMTPTYNPPADERCYLGADQPELILRHVVFRVEDNRKRKQGTDMRRATASEQDGDARPKPITAPIQFRRQAPRRVNTSSELTASFERSHEEKRTTLAEKFASEGLDCNELPSAFDSDDEEECQDTWHGR